MTSKSYVTIQSDIDVTVTGGLYYEDHTDPLSHTNDKLKVSPSWTNVTIDIKKGKGIYPAEIANWNTVKALEKDGLLTIGSFTDNCNDEKIIKTKNDLNESIKKISSLQKAKLSEIAGED